MTAASPTNQADCAKPRTFLHEGLVSIGFGKDSFSGIKTLPILELEEKMESYICALQEYNAKFDLINTDDHDEIVVRHILDSLAALPALCAEISSRTANAENGFLIADIGSGSGFPGIPLASALPDFQFVLVERMTKRCGFLGHASQLLDLRNIIIEENQAERLEQKRFDVAVFRAFRPLDKKMTKVLLRILKDDGFLAAYKAKKEKITEEMSLIPQQISYKILPLTVPFLTENSISSEERERNLVVIKKSMDFQK
ncbi:MAG: 16S rRNA (guanine(527)-N(7))-methyltransferase RsmG [Treponema sp.]|nr:16S rRNA (guanine(527)-N(7))-methyltransferase RsmG [Treponema sp.]